MIPLAARGEPVCGPERLWDPKTRRGGKSEADGGSQVYEVADRDIERLCMIAGSQHSADRVATLAFYRRSLAFTGSRHDELAVEW